MRTHVLRNAMLPVVTMLGMDIGLALGGAIFTEIDLQLPGAGANGGAGAAATTTSPTVMGVIVFSTIMIIVFNLDRRPALRSDRPAHPAGIVPARPHREHLTVRLWHFSTSKI